MNDCVVGEKKLEQVKCNVGVFLAKEWFQRVWGLGCVINAVHVLLSLVAWRGVCLCQVWKKMLRHFAGPDT